MMKKMCLFLFCVVLLVPVFSLEAVVVSVLGKAEMQTAKGWEPVKAGTKLAAGTMISTGFKSQAVLGIGKSTVTVQPLSRLTVEQLTERADTDVSKIFLDAGSIKADVKAAENKRVGFTVKSPIATASVRGTAGNIDAFGLLESSSGVWMVHPASDENAGKSRVGIAVEKGSGIMIDADGRITAPQQYNTRATINSNPLTVSPSVAEISNSGIASASAEAQNAGGNETGSAKITIPISIGWDD